MNLWICNPCGSERLKFMGCPWLLLSNVLCPIRQPVYCCKSNNTRLSMGCLSHGHTTLSSLVSCIGRAGLRVRLPLFVCVSCESLHTGTPNVHTLSLCVSLSTSCSPNLHVGSFSAGGRQIDKQLCHVRWGSRSVLAER